MVSAATARLARKAVREMERHLEVPSSSAEELNLTTARMAVEDLWEAVRSLISVLPSPPEDLAFRTLLRSYKSFEALSQHRRELAASRLAEAFTDEIEGEPADSSLDELIEALNIMVAELKRPEAERLAAEIEFASDAVSESMALYSQVLTEVLVKEATEARVRVALRALMSNLQIGQDEMGRLFEMSGETIRRWERGKTRVPLKREAEILEVEAGLRRLLEIFRPDRLPLVVRRDAKLFDGEPALEWILRGRMGDVVERYEATFAYQG